MKIVVTGLIGVFCFCFLSAPLAQTGCKLKEEIDGIKVYTCDPILTEFNTVKVEFSMDVKITDYLELLKDISSYKDWQYRAK